MQDNVIDYMVYDDSPPKIWEGYLFYRIEDRKTGKSLAWIAIPSLPSRDKFLEDNHMGSPKERLQTRIDEIKAEYKKRKASENMNVSMYDYVIGSLLQIKGATIVTLPNYDVLFF